jgi:hypothetical protein
MKTRTMISTASASAIVGISAIALAFAGSAAAADGSQSGGSSSYAYTKDHAHAAAAVERGQSQGNYHSVQTTKAVSVGMALNGHYLTETESEQDQSTDDFAQTQTSATVMNGKSDRKGFAGSTAITSVENTDGQQTSEGETSAVASGDSKSVAAESSTQENIDL